MKANKQKKELSRRDVLKKSSLATFGFTFLPAYLTAAKSKDNPLLPPSERVNLGCIGVGGIAIGTVKNIAGNGQAVPVAFADVDYNHKKSERNGSSNPKNFPKAVHFNDFRVMLDKMGKDIDAVSVCTPDHTHFTATITAMSMGKHVYTQKPLTYTFEESEILMRAEKKFKVITQMGNQGHTGGGTAQFENFMKHGIANDIVKIEAFMKSGLWYMKDKGRLSKYPAPSAPPKSLKNWDLWCGPRKKIDYREMLHPASWRGWFDYGNGMFGDWGAHIIDFAHHYLELGLPTKINPVKLIEHNELSFPKASHITFDFPERASHLPACQMVWKEGDEFESIQADEKYANPGQAAPMVNDGGTLLYRKQEDYVIRRGHHGDVSRIYPFTVMKEFGQKVKAPRPEYSHHESFIQAIKGNCATNSPFSIAGPLSQTLILGALAQRLNVELNFDIKSKKIIGNDVANALLNPPAREEWAHLYKLA
ncbi:MAG: Gfo/Idh/MocA family oxidoreductase [Planctomycetes bacterium]|nr:Gfo/Idh/MocA family oxidoreductase [Planctomycetota bacterium]